MSPSSPPSASERIFWIDVLRGIAIVLMIPANLAPFLTEPHAMWFRLAGSFSAPTFIALSAGMVILRARHHSLRYYLIRGGLVTLVGVLLDALLWRILPFTSFDVLYIIGPGIPLIYLSHRRSGQELALLGVILMLAGPILQSRVGYDPVPLQVYWNDFSWPGLPRLAASWFIDGWFPILPWMGFAFIGAALAKTSFDPHQVHHIRRLIIPGLVLATAGFILLFANQTLLPGITEGTVIPTREGYSEIFYPPTIAYMLAACGILLVAISTLSHIGPSAWDAYPAYFGRYSMMVYILHQAIGELALKPILALNDVEQLESGWMFLAINLFVFAIITLVCMGLDAVKRRWPPTNIALQVLIGR